MTSDLVPQDPLTAPPRGRLLRSKRFIPGLSYIGKGLGKGLQWTASIGRMLSMDVYWTKRLVSGLGHQNEACLYLIRSLVIFFGAAALPYYWTLRHYEFYHRTRLHLPPQVWGFEGYW